MSTSTVISPPKCPQCGAERVAGSTVCWLCRAPLAEGEGLTGPNPYAAPQSLARPPQFGLASLMLVITLAGLCLGLVTVAPGLIVPLLVFVIPAIIRTTIVTSRRAVDGAQQTLGNKVLTFLASLGIVYVVWMAGVVAFFGACSVMLAAFAAAPAARNLEQLLIVLLIAAAVGSLMLVVWLFIKTLPKAK